MKFRIASLIALMFAVAVFASWFRQTGRDPQPLVFAGFILAPAWLALLSGFFQSMDPAGKTWAAYVFLATLLLMAAVSRLAPVVMLAFFIWPPQLIVLHEIHNQQAKKIEQDKFRQMQRAEAAKSRDARGE